MQRLKRVCNAAFVLCARKTAVKRATAFIGAGAAIDIGGPTSARLTSEVRAAMQVYYVPIPSRTQTPPQLQTVPFLDQVGDHLDQFFLPDQANFEDIFHALETLSSLSRGWGQAAKKFKPHACAFTHASNRRKWFGSEVLLGTAKGDLLRTVGDNIDAYDDSFDPLHAHSWFAQFWQDAVEACHWDIATLNYDTCITQSLHQDPPEDGFEDTGHGFGCFKPRKLLQPDVTRILHLHGCIRYGYPQLANPNAFIFEEQFEDLYKYQDYQSARKTWSGRSSNQSQAGEEAIAGPIITGLRKTDKLLGYPYSTYYHTLSEALMHSPRLLIMGYSCGDYHFNSVLKRMVLLHGSDRRIVIVTWFPKPDLWHPEGTVIDWPGLEEYDLLATLFRQSTLFTSFQFQSPVVSDDGCARLYLEGAKDAMQNHGNSILNFLMS